MKPILIELTPEQRGALMGHMNEIKKMAREGKPGMLVAQLDGSDMIVGILSHEQGKVMFEMISGKPWKDETVKSMVEKARCIG